MGNSVGHGVGQGYGIGCSAAACHGQRCCRRLYLRGSNGEGWTHVPSSLVMHFSKKNLAQSSNKLKYANIFSSANFDIGEGGYSQKKP